MIELESRLDIAASPMKVWRALSDFSAYPRWNPYREIVGIAALGERVVLRIGLDPGKRRPLPARITAFEPGRVLEFSSGRPFLMQSMEIFELERCQRGTRLRHVARMTGIGSRIVARTFGPRLIKVYRRVDEALAQFVAPGMRSKRQPPK
jgi:uncharacterized protein YndB with AHSA1/START domain